MRRRRLRLVSAGAGDGSRSDGARTAYLVIVVVLAMACGGKPAREPLTQRAAWTPPHILQQVPADTPYLFALLEPFDNRLRDKMMVGAEQQLDEAMRRTDSIDPNDRPPWMRAARVVLDELRGQPS